MQTAGSAIEAATEFTAGMQLGVNQLHSAQPSGRLSVYRHPTSVVTHLN